MCVRPSEPSSTATFIAPDGKIVVPITHNDITDGKLMFIPQEDFVLTHLSLVITRSFVAEASTYFSIGTKFGYPVTEDGKDDLISMQQGANEHLKANTIILASSNTNTTARLAPVGTEIYMKGSVSPDLPENGHQITIFTDGAGSSGKYTDGEAKIILRGYYLNF